MKRNILISLGLALLPFGMLHAIDFSVAVPDGARVAIGSKTAHYVDFTESAPTGTSSAGGVTTLTFDLTAGKVYNYRVSMNGGLTHAGYFTMNADASKCPVLKFSAADFKVHNPKDINHSVQSNEGYETGDVFVNINPQGYLRLDEGATFDLHAMRSWELTDNAVNNYFIEPDFHFAVVDLDGHPSSDVISITETPGSPWAEIKAVGKGTAIVLVTYDGINLNYYSGSEKKDYLGGAYWGAVWSENTGVFVVSVGQDDSSVVAGMKLNEGYNNPANKLAADLVDSEHDVFYYLEGTEGATYSFTPQNAVKVEIAYPTVGQSSLAFSGFSEVAGNGDGSWSLLLREGRQIVRLSDAQGRSTYQVLTAKECSRTISNASREGSSVFQPGDEIKVVYSGLRHPANKLAGIYNMSAYITYNNTPNGTSLIQNANQYTFGSSEAAQTLTIKIPEDIDPAQNAVFSLNDGVIQVNGYGDPIGNHRSIVKGTGRNPNLNAVAHKTYFGSLPEIAVALQPVHLFSISLVPNVEGAEISLVYNGEKQLSPDAEGLFSGTYGEYEIVARLEGYRCFRSQFVLGEDDDDSQSFEVNLEKGAPGMWNGSDTTDIEADIDGVYHVSTGAELAYISRLVNEKSNKFTSRVVLDADIDLGGFDWTPIANGSKTYFAGVFDGQGHEVKDLYINDPTLDYAGLFGNVQGLSSSAASVSNLTVSGFVAGKQYVGGIAGKVDKYASADCCANHADVSGQSYVGGIVGYLSASTKCSLSNSYNTGSVSGSTSVGGVVGYNNKSALINNIFNVGEVFGAANSTGACVGGTTVKINVSKAYSSKVSGLEDCEAVSDDQMRSGEVAYKLGEPFGQSLGVHEHPVLNGDKVYLNETTGEYYNIPMGIDGVEIGEGNVDVYDLTGRILLRNVPQSRVAALVQGLYVIRSGAGSRTVLVR